MATMECEKCFRAFIPEDEKTPSLVSGRGFGHDKDKNEGIKCPYCGHIQERGTLFMFGG